MRSKRRRLIPGLGPLQCCCGPRRCKNLFIPDLEADDASEFTTSSLFANALSSSSIDEAVENAEGPAVPGEGGLLFVDTHTHITEVFFEMKVQDEVTSLSKAWEDMTDAERESWTFFGWNERRWRSYRSSRGGDQSSESSAGAWAEHTTKYGTPYFWNSKTGDHSWDRPAGYYSPHPEELEKGNVSLAKTPKGTVSHEVQADVSVLTRDADQERCSSDAVEVIWHDAWDTEWSNLKAEECNAALALGYNKVTWPGNQEVPDLVIPCEQRLRSILPQFGCICTACDGPSLDQVLELHRAIPLPPKRSTQVTDAFPALIWATVGIHPKEAGSFIIDNPDDPWTALEAFEERQERLAIELGERLVGWGEIGLDYSHAQLGKVWQNQWFQQQVFVRQIAMGVERGLPLCIHTRDAWADTIRLLKETVPSDHPVHLHCFWYGQEEMEEFLKAFPKSVIGFSNSLFYPGEDPQIICPIIPLDNIVLETDAPYLPRNGQPISTPKDVPEVGKKVAELKGIPFCTVMDIIRQNVLRTYGI